MARLEEQELGLLALLGREEWLFCDVGKSLRLTSMVSSNVTVLLMTACNEKFFH